MHDTIYIRRKFSSQFLPFFFLSARSQPTGDMTDPFDGAKLHVKLEGRKEKKNMHTQGDADRVKIGEFVLYLSPSLTTISIKYICQREAQRLINLEIPVLVRSLKSSKVELGLCLHVPL